MTVGVLCSARSRVNAAFRPTRGRRFVRTEYRPFVHGGVFSPHGTAIRVRPVGRDVAEWFGVDSGFVTT